MRHLIFLAFLAFSVSASAQEPELSDCACCSAVHRIFEPLEGEWTLRALEGPDVSGTATWSQSLNGCAWSLKLAIPGAHSLWNLSFQKNQLRWLALVTNALGDTELLEGAKLDNRSIVFIGAYLPDGKGGLYANRWRMLLKENQWELHQETARADGSLWMLQRSWLMEKPD